MRDPNDIIDEYLVLQCQNGNKKALIKLVKRWHPKILRQATWQTGNQEVAKDIAQECWSDVLKGINKLRNSKAFKVWMYRIIHRRSVDWIRQQQQNREDVAQINEEVSTPEANNNHRDQVLLLQKYMKQMSYEQQTILKLFYLESLRIREIAIVLSIPHGTVKSRLHHARESLKKRIKLKHYEK